MKPRALLIGDSPVALWSLPAKERLRRQLKSLGIGLLSGAGEISAHPEPKVLILRCDFLFELRTLEALLEKGEFLLFGDDGSDLAAALVSAGDAGPLSEFMARQMSANAEAGEAAIPAGHLPRGDRRDLSVYDRKLRRAEPPLLERLAPERTGELENLLYGNAYKGVTDLVTKWFWPRPAKWLVRHCAARAITPNQVTGISLGLVILAGFLFYHGQFALGLLAGWLMTLLDTVDGKLARVRVESSPIGNIFDHGIDLIHPPFWYLLWAMGLQNAGYDISIPLLGTLIFAGYIGGRLAEGAFQKFCGGSIFVWRPFDSWSRLVTARRNPCLIILTVAVVFHAPLTGLWTLTGWTLLSTLILWLRFYQGLGARRALQAPLPSWLESPRAGDMFPLSYPVFSRTGGAYRG